MSAEEDKAFEDQIERMKQRNQHILEKFQASEEDRKRAETQGAAIKKDQNISIRLKPEEIPRMKGNKFAKRSKSFHGSMNNSDQHHHISYGQYLFNRKQNNFHNKNDSKANEEQIAYQDYKHFQQVYCSNKSSDCQNINRNTNWQNNQYKHGDNQYNQRLPTYKDFTRIHNQNAKSQVPFRSTQNNYHQRSKISKETNAPHYQDYQNSRISRDGNEFHNNRSKETLKKSHSFSNSSIQTVQKKQSKSKGKPITTTNNVMPQVNGTGDSTKSNVKNKTVPFDDEYIDDTLEDLEQYRLKVDLEDFIVIDPESPDPILAMPLKPWTSSDILSAMEINKCDGESKQNDSSADLLNSVNERAKEYLNLVNQNNIGGASYIAETEVHSVNEVNNHCIDEGPIKSLEQQFSEKASFDEVKETGKEEIHKQTANISQKEIDIIDDNKEITENVNKFDDNIFKDVIENEVNVTDVINNECGDFSINHLENQSSISTAIDIKI